MGANRRSDDRRDCSTNKAADATKDVPSSIGFFYYNFFGCDSLCNYCGDWRLSRRVSTATQLEGGLEVQNDTLYTSGVRFCLGSLHAYIQLQKNKEFGSRRF